ncbi:hypothetical protein PTMSG1_03592 [Pyrenophora teres f. maculata]|nr:hypothetical protein PTMSG1_03592 [Pyrenophora teres f. maculata]
MADNVRYRHQHRRGVSRGEGGEFEIRDQAEQSPPMTRMEKRRKRTREYNNRRRRENGTARTEYSRGTKYEHTIAAADTSFAPQPPTPRSENRQGYEYPDKERSKQATRLAKAQESAANYPPLDNQSAWQALGRETNIAARDNSAFVYRHLRRDQRPEALSYKEWVSCVHREMEGLGLQGLRDEVIPGKEDGEPVGGNVVVTETVAVQEGVLGVQEARYEDDGFDIDIFGDEETRARYGPWMRSPTKRRTARS